MYKVSEMIHLLLIRGLPGSGKTTLAKNIVSLSGFEQCRVFEADQYFMVDGEYKFDASKLGQAHYQCQVNTRQALEQGLFVMVANTFTKRSELEPYYDIAEGLNKTVSEIICTGDYGSTHGVPFEVIEKMRTRFEW